MPETLPPNHTGMQTRSCLKCNQRKTRCSRSQPCASCVKLGIDCVFPPPGPVPRRRKRALKAELVSRVKVLEQKLEEASGNELAAQTVLKQSDAYSGPNTPTQVKYITRSSLDDQHVNHEAYEGPNHNVRLNLVAPSSESDEHPSDYYSSAGFLFGYRALARPLDELHPSPDLSRRLWDVYEQNVAPLVPILHKPTVHAIINQAANKGAQLDKTSEALVFAVYFMAVISMKPGECSAEFEEDHKVLIQRYRFATEQALARANFLHASSLEVLQALVLFLIGVWRTGDACFMWTMTALAYRLAQCLGLHRDGTKLGLGSFQIEMRRRLWWYIYLLDVQSCEHQPSSSQIYEGTYDTALPLNINDSDISPEMTGSTAENTGYTEMTFLLIRCEINTRHRRMSQAGFNLDSGQPALEHTIEALIEINTVVEDKYLRYCNLNDPIQWVAATVTRLALARSWLVAHFSLLENKAMDVTIWKEHREALFLTAIEVVEFSYLLENSEQTAHWAWMFEMYRQWYALAFVLSELCVRPESAVVDRAWRIAKTLYQSWQEKGPSGGVFWEPVTRLMRRVEAKRTTLRPNLGPTAVLLNRDSADLTLANSYRIPSIWAYPHADPPGGDGSPKVNADADMDMRSLEIYSEAMKGINGVCNTEPI
ncbi:fungal-specific transcription factor domain-containing protein [Aspergillus karnatakaensis]|uniref:transcription factor domain-containing protein n=1 Tax=Aspergillus karnatakaensis TaxID=1810916 RepID=UPI003CCD2341